MLADVRSGSFSTESGGSRNVRITPDSDQKSDIASCPLCANNDPHQHAGRNV
jgi:hypothetical protein